MRNWTSFVLEHTVTVHVLWVMTNGNKSTPNKEQQAKGTKIVSEHR